jgi:hypothetical protein
MADVTTGLQWVIAGAGLVGSAVGWFVRELWAERVAERRAERDYARQVRALRHERRTQIAEHALTQLHMTAGNLSGMLRAFRGEVEGKVRPEITASVIRNAQDRISRLSEESHQALGLLRFYFGDTVVAVLDEGETGAAEATEKLSEFMTLNDMMLNQAQWAYEQNTNGVLDDTTYQETVQSIQQLSQQQVERLSRVIELVDSHRQSLRKVEGQLRQELWSDTDNKR